MVRLLCEARRVAEWRGKWYNFVFATHHVAARMSAAPLEYLAPVPPPVRPTARVQRRLPVLRTWANVDFGRHDVSRLLSGSARFVRFCSLSVGLSLARSLARSLSLLRPLCV